MQELYYEESSKCKNEKSEKAKYTIMLVLSIVSFVLAFIWILIIVTFLDLEANFLLNFIVYIVPLIIFLVIGIILFKLKDNFCIDYDYIFVTGSIRISKVINSLKRKSIYKFNTDAIEKIGRVNSETYKGYFNNINVKKVLLTQNQTSEEGKDFYYIIVNIKNEKQLLVLECSKTFIVNVLKFSKLTVRDKDLK